MSGWNGRMVVTEITPLLHGAGVHPAGGGAQQVRQRPGVGDVVDPHHFQVPGWYDNEWGYTARLADLAALVGSRL
jgi:hypothetical protein